MVEFEKSNAEEIRNELIRRAENLRRKKGMLSANFGMVASLGGVIIVPLLLGIFLGGYLDEKVPVSFSWRLSCLFMGAVWGAFNAYFWVKNEENKIRKMEEKSKQGEGKSE